MNASQMIINPGLLDSEKIKELNYSFNNKEPFKFLVIDNFLITEAAEQVEAVFPSIDSMKVRYKGINEHKAEDSSFDKFDPIIQQLNVFIHSPLLNEWVSNVTGLKGLSSIDDRLGAGLHQGGNKSFLDIHLDYNIHPIHKKQRKLNLLIFFNKGWKEEWGGQLELWDKSSCFTKILPSFNRMVLFECNEISYHGYSTINCPDLITRKSYYHYFFQPIVAGTIYHDTIFLTKASYSFRKKTLTKSKEFLKNKIKLIFYKTGLRRFLK